MSSISTGGLAILVFVCVAGAAGTLAAPPAPFPAWSGVAVPLMLTVLLLLRRQRPGALDLCALGSAAAVLNAGRMGLSTLAPIALGLSAVVLAFSVWKRRKEPAYPAQMIRVLFWVVAVIAILLVPFMFMDVP